MALSVSGSSLVMGSSHIHTLYLNTVKTSVTKLLFKNKTDLHVCRVRVRGGQLERKPIRDNPKIFTKSEKMFLKSEKIFQIVMFLGNHR